MILTKEHIQTLRDFCDDHDYDLREDYSGRCMYGKSCIGFVTDDHPFSVAVNLCNYADDKPELIELFTNTGVREDSMGKRTIVYFPGLTKE